MNPLCNRRVACIVLTLPLLFLPAIAEDSRGDSEDAVPARIRALEGEATLERELERDRLEATINTPVFPGDRIALEDGPLELQLPDGSLVWMDSETVLELVALEDSYDDSREGSVLKLIEGTLETKIEAGKSGEASMRVDTPESSVYLMSRGRFRIETYGGVTTVTSYRGVAELAGDEGSTLIRSGQQSRVQSGSGAEDPWPVNTLRLDNFGEWCQEREASFIADSEEEIQEYVEEVPREVRHYVSELNYYGDWQFVGTFGWVWRPSTIQVGWRPYYSGYWCWRPGGWTWISYEPWGWLPYHYGRWTWATGAGWVWIPGAVYSGAWVTWAVTPTYVGWCPLDFYNRPAYVRYSYTGATVNHYGGGWNFLPLNRWGERSLSRDIVRADRVPQLHGAVTTRELPRFDPNQARVRPDIVQRVVRDKSPQIQRTDPAPPAGGTSFRQTDRRERVNSKRPVPGAGNQETVRKPGPRGVVPPASNSPDVGKRTPVYRDTRSAQPVRPRRADEPSATSKSAVAPRARAQESPKGTPPRVPSSSDDPSRRVLDRILREENSVPRSAAASPGRGRDAAKKQTVRGEGREEGKPSAERPQPRRETPPPAKKQDTSKKKDKP